MCVGLLGYARPKFCHQRVYVWLCTDICVPPICCDNSDLSTGGSSTARVGNMSTQMQTELHVCAISRLCATRWTKNPHHRVTKGYCAAFSSIQALTSSQHICPLFTWAGKQISIVSWIHRRTNPISPHFLFPSSVMPSVSLCPDSEHLITAAKKTRMSVFIR